MCERPRPHEAHHSPTRWAPPVPYSWPSSASLARRPPGEVFGALAPECAIDAAWPAQHGSPRRRRHFEAWQRQELRFSPVRPSACLSSWVGTRRTSMTLSPSSGQTGGPQRWCLLLAPASTSTRVLGNRWESVTKCAPRSLASITLTRKWCSPGSVPTCPSSCSTCPSTVMSWTTTCSLLSTGSCVLLVVTYRTILSSSRPSRLCCQPNHVSPPGLHHG